MGVLAWQAHTGWRGEVGEVEVPGWVEGPPCSAGNNAVAGRGEAAKGYSGTFSLTRMQKPRTRGSASVCHEKVPLVGTAKGVRSDA